MDPIQDKQGTDFGQTSLPKTSAGDTKWISPIVFNSNHPGFSSKQDNREYLSFVSAKLLGLKDVGPEWWVQKAIKQQSAKPLEEGQSVNLAKLHVTPSGYPSLHCPELNGAIIAAASRLGLEFHSDFKFVYRSGLLVNQQQTAKSFEEQSAPSTPRPLRISKVPILAPTDPRIYRPDIGTHQSCSGSSERWMELMEWEGQTDAQCVIKYHQAYNRLIENPNLDNLLSATENPSMSTDSYFLGMMHIGDQFGLASLKQTSPSEEQKGIGDFLGLIHLAFYPHFLSRRISNGDRFPLDASDKRLLGALLDEFIAEH